MGRTTHYVGDSCPDGHRNDPTTPRDKAPKPHDCSAGNMVGNGHGWTCVVCGAEYPISPKGKP